MNTDIIAECMSLSFANTPFPEIVRKLADAGVSSYTADSCSCAAHITEKAVRAPTNRCH